MSSQDQEESLNPQEVADTLREAQEELSSFRQLVNSNGFKRFVAYLEQQMEVRKQNVFLNALPGLDAVFEQEYAKGEIAGLHHARNFVEIHLSALSENIKAYEKELGYAEDSEVPSDGNPGGRLELGGDSVDD